MAGQRLPGQQLTDQAGLRKPPPARRRPTVMTVAEFRRLGYLEHLNRLLLHPLGLALDVEISPDGLEQFGAVWDCRDEPAGCVYPADHDWTGHAERIGQEWAAREPARTAELGFMVQEPPR